MRAARAATAGNGRRISLNVAPGIGFAHVQKSSRSRIRREAILRGGVAYRGHA